MGNFLGKKHTEESNEKNRLAHLGRTSNAKQLEGLKLGRGWNKGKKTPDITIKKLSEAHLGQVPWNKGLKGYKAGNLHWAYGKKRPEVSGSNSNLWRGGVLSEHKAIRRGAENKRWRKQVFERDDYTCQACGERGGELHADHDLPFALFPDLRFEVLNGQTLCVSCHRRKDTTTHINRLESIHMFYYHPTKIACTISKSITAD